MLRSLPNSILLLTICTALVNGAALTTLNDRTFLHYQRAHLESQVIFHNTSVPLSKRYTCYSDETYCGTGCIPSTATCCADGNGCDSGYFCCNDNRHGCCAVGDSCGSGDTCKVTPPLHHGLGSGAIVGIVFGALIVAGILLCCGICCYAIRGNKKTTPKAAKKGQSVPVPAPAPTPTPKLESADYSAPVPQYAQHVPLQQYTQHVPPQQYPQQVHLPQYAQH